MQRSLIDTVVGALVLVVAALFLAWAYRAGGVERTGGMHVMATFDRVDGLQTGSNVQMAGITIGRVTGQRLDPETYLAVVDMDLDPSIKIPDDSSAEIVGDGLLGGKHMTIVPGGSTEMLQDGSHNRYTQSPTSLEQLIGQLVFSTSGGGGGDGGAGDTGAMPDSGLSGAEGDMPAPATGSN